MLAGLAPMYPRCVAYDRDDAREQRRNELARRLADARARAGVRAQGDWRAALPAIGASALLLVAAPDVLSYTCWGEPIGVIALLRGALGTTRDVTVAAVRSTEAGRRWLNTPPTANPSPAVVLIEAATVTLDGEDPDGDPLTIRIVEPPRQGRLDLPSTMSAPLDIRYTPRDGFAGEDSFTFVVSDGLEESAPLSRGLRVFSPVEAAVGGLARAPGAPVPGQVFSPEHPEALRGHQITADYLVRGSEVLDGSERARMAEEARRDEEGLGVTIPVSLPPLVTNAQLGGGY